MKEYIKPKIKYLKVNEDSLLASQSGVKVFDSDTETDDQKFTGLSKEHHSVWDSEDEEY